MAIGTTQSGTSNKTEKLLMVAGAVLVVVCVVLYGSGLNEMKEVKQGGFLFRYGVDSMAFGIAGIALLALGFYMKMKNGE